MYPPRNPCGIVRRLAAYVRAMPALLVLSLISVACQDSATGPVDTQSEAAAGSTTAQLATPYVCSTSLLKPGSAQPYATGHLPNLQFPQRALAKDGTTVRYRYRGYASGDKLVRTADCVIPRTDAAVKIMTERFLGRPAPAGLTPGGPGLSLGGPSPVSGLAPRGPVFSADGEIDGIVVRTCQYGDPTAYPNCESPPPPSDNYKCDPAFQYCGGDTGGTGGGSGDGSGSVALTTGEIESDIVPDTLNKANLNCGNPASAMEFALCHSTPLQAGSTYHKRVEAAIARIEQRGGYCATIAGKGRDLLARGDIGMFPSGLSWTNPTTGGRERAAGGYGAGNIGVHLEENWFINDTLKNYKGFNLDTVLAHEIEHTFGAPHVRADADGWEYTEHDLACGG